MTVEVSNITRRFKPSKDAPVMCYISGLMEAFIFIGVLGPAIREAAKEASREV